MTNTEPVQQTLQLMVSQVEQEERATSEKKRAANELSRILGQPPVFPDVEYASAIATLPDEYYGHQGHEVIRLVLEKRKRANLGSATVAEIHHAMLQGGYRFNTDNHSHAKRGVYAVLADPLFHKLPDGRYGLASWYPTAKARAENQERKLSRVIKRKKKKAGKKNHAEPKLLEYHEPPKATETPVPSGNGPTIGPTDAVVNYIQTHPRCTSSQVVSAVIGRVSTNSKNERTMLHAAIRKLVHSGKVRRVGEQLEFVE